MRPGPRPSLNLKGRKRPLSPLSCGALGNTGTCAAGDRHHAQNALGRGGEVSLGMQMRVDQIELAQSGEACQRIARQCAQPIPVDLITTSASGLDPEISPAAAEFQIPRIARERGVAESALRDLVQKHTAQRDLGLLGEPRVNVLELNLALDDLASKR